MANQKLSELTAAGSIAPTDTLYLVSGGASKKVTAQTLFNAPVGGVFNVRAYGAAGNGIADDSAAVLAAVAAAYNAGGGIVLFPIGTYLMLSQLALPNNGANPPFQPPITLLGQGARWNLGITDGPGASVLDLRYNGTVAKIDTRGFGLLTIEGLTLADNGTSTLPFLQTTNTALLIRDNAFLGNPTKIHATCDQDAIVIGGTTTNTDGSGTAAFQGYGTVIERNLFARIRRGVYGRVWCNGVVIQNNMWTGTCGSDNTAAAIELDGSVGFVRGNLITGNLIELTGYVYGVTLRNASNNRCQGNDYWDSTAGLIAAVRIVSTNPGGSIDNSFIGEYFDSSKNILDETGGNSYLAFSSTHVLSPIQFERGATVRPVGTGGTADDVMLGIYRSVSDPTNPGAEILKVKRSGVFELHGTEASPNAYMTIYNQNGGYAGLSASGNLTSSDALHILSGSDSKAIYFERGYVCLPIQSTANRPGMNGRPGIIMWDSTLGKLIVSNGSAWVDMAGNVV